MTDDGTLKFPASEIGYGKPPKSGQFVKGKSGNPKGRPRRNDKLASFQAADQPTDEIILQESYRTVVVMEGDKKRRMPVNQAVLRSLGIAAMKGNRQAQRLQIELAQSVEQRKSAEKLAIFKWGVETVAEWTKACDYWDANGIPRPDPVPHPEDFILDFDRGEVRIFGPRTPEQKERMNTILGLLADFELAIGYCANERETARPTRRKFLAEFSITLRRKFDEINDQLPKRYRRTLKDKVKETLVEA